MANKTALFLALVLLGQAEARSFGGEPAKTLKVEPATAAVAPTKAKKAALVAAKISPPVSETDKKFFGPPFPANYPEDKRPAVDKALMDKLKGPGQPYPALQSKADYDSDYVKDENSDKGAWKAQFEYDNLRKKLAKEAAEAKAAADRAAKEEGDLTAAEKAARDAAKAAEDAKNGVNDARNGENSADKDEDFGGPPSAEKLEKLKKAVDEAEAKYAKEQKDFEACKAALEDAKKNLEELKAKQVEMEAQLASETKLWMETKNVRLNLQKTKEEAAHSKTLAAHERLTAARNAKADMDKILADKKALHDKALQGVQKEKADLAKAHVDLEKATLVLQKLRGYKPQTPAKSAATTASALLSVSALFAMHLF